MNGERKLPKNCLVLLLKHLSTMLLLKGGFHKCLRLHCCPGNFIPRANWKPSDKLFIKLSSNFPLKSYISKYPAWRSASNNRAALLRYKSKQFFCKHQGNPKFSIQWYFSATWVLLENAMFWDS